VWADVRSAPLAADDPPSTSTIRQADDRGEFDPLAFGHDPQSLTQTNQCLCGAMTDPVSQRSPQELVVA
jgi:hypothetical protein